MANEVNDTIEGDFTAGGGAGNVRHKAELLAKMVATGNELANQINDLELKLRDHEARMEAKIKEFATTLKPNGSYLTSAGVLTIFMGIGEPGPRVMLLPLHENCDHAELPKPGDEVPF